nr:probable protein phosphatase 2C 60 [Tanacetum cinerariifolium]
MCQPTLPTPFTLCDRVSQALADRSTDERRCNNAGENTRDIETSVQKSFIRMDEMMREKRGWRELSALGDKINIFTCVIEGLIWSSRVSQAVAEMKTIRFAFRRMHPSVSQEQ